MTTDNHWMARALALAARARGRTAPNPMVGAVVVPDGEVLGEGWHVAPGHPHGEPAALANVQGSATGATVYVNLEPCCFHGRTPPCTDALIEAGVARVVVGIEDPFPRVAGQGLARLKAAGIDVQVGVEADACRALNAGYLSRVERGRPRVWLKAGCTLDGRITDHQGRSKWITGPGAREHGHRLRDHLDAILVGSHTLLDDDPSLNCRLDGGRDPLPVVLDSSLRCPPSAKVLTAGRRARIYCASDAPDRDLPADVVRVPRGPGGLDVAAVLADLADQGVNDLLVEGGGRVHRSLLDAGLADRLLLFVAPKVLAGGTGFVGGTPLDLPDAYTFSVVEVSTVGGEVLIELECQS